MSVWLVWLILGLGMLVTEMLSMTFVLVFFGVGALVSALLAAVGIDSLAIQILACAAVGVCGLFLFRKKLLSGLKADGQTSGNDILDEKIMLDQDIAARSQATISYRGAPWTALNQSEINLKQGEMIRIIRIEGVKLVVEKL